MASYTELLHLRPSLLTCLLRTLGPGTVICKSAALSRRNDGTSHEILRRCLPTYNFLPIPDAHFPFPTSQNKTDIDNLRAANKLLTDEDCTISQFFKTYLPEAQSKLQYWTQCLAALDKGTFCNFVESQYTLPEFGPIVIIGSPECYLGYDCPQGETTQLRTLLDNCGYSTTLRLNKGSDGGSVVVQTPKTVHQQSHSFRDISTLFLSFVQTSSTNVTRLVAILAGAANPFGTYAAVRIATDSTRTDVARLVHAFIKSKKTRPHFMIFRTTSSDYSRNNADNPEATWSKVQLALPHVDLPIISELLTQAGPSTTQHSQGLRQDIKVRQAEMWLTKRSMDLSRAAPGESVLIKYLNDKPAVSVVAKCYPEDIRDDEDAKDLLEFNVVNSVFYPLLPGLPVTTDSDKFLAFCQHVASLLNESFSELIYFLKIDGETTAQVSAWNALIAASENGSSLANYISQNSRLPEDGPIIVLGGPESFLGGEPALRRNNLSASTQLAGLMHKCEHPNRFEFLSDRSAIFDHVRRCNIPLVKSSSDDSLHDLGYILLTRDDTERDVLIIAGRTSLGTLAGVQLLFGRTQPMLDRAILQYIQRNRSCVEVAYSCRQVATLASGGPSLAVEDPPRVKSGNRLGLEIQVLVQPGETRFRRSRSAEQNYRCFFNVLYGKLTSDQIVCPDDNFEWTVNRNNDRYSLTVTCKQIWEIEKREWCFGESASSQLTRLKEFCLRHKEDWKSLTESDRAGGRCVSILVLGETGVGKELIHHLVAAIIGGGPKIAVNCTQFRPDFLVPELFGYGPNAWTGGNPKGHNGRIQTAHGGTLFLDECFIQTPGVGDLLQSQLLRFLETGKITEKVMTTSETEVNVHLVFASNFVTNINELNDACNRGVIRRDFCARIGHIVELPPLRERSVEIIPAFVLALSRNPQDTVSMSVRALDMLVHHSFPNNFREFRVMREKWIGSGSNTIRASDMANWLGIEMASEGTSDDTATVEVKIVLPTSSQPHKSHRFESTSWANLTESSIPTWGNKMDIRKRLSLDDWESRFLGITRSVVSSDTKQLETAIAAVRHLACAIYNWKNSFRGPKKERMENRGIDGWAGRSLVILTQLPRTGMAKVVEKWRERRSRYECACNKILEMSDFNLSNVPSDVVRWAKILVTMCLTGFDARTERETMEMNKLCKMWSEECRFGSK